MGKGVPAALVAASMKSTLFRVLGELNSGSQNKNMVSPIEIIHQVTEKISGEISMLESYVTLNYSRIDLMRNTLRFVDCGHVAILRHSIVTGTTDRIKGGDAPIGVEPSQTYHEHWLPIENTDLLLFYSDGITEARSPEGDFFGETRLSMLLKEFSNLSPNKLTAKIRDEVKLFTGEGEIKDDLTCVAITFDEQMPHIKPESSVSIPCELGEISQIRKWIDGILAKKSADVKRNYSITLGVHEAVANCIEHGKQLVPDDEITVLIYDLSPEFYVLIRDQRQHFKHMYNTETREEQRDRGFGLQILRNIFDSITYYSSTDGTNSLVLCARIERS